MSNHMISINYSNPNVSQMIRLISSYPGYFCHIEKIPMPAVSLLASDFLKATYLRGTSGTTSTATIFCEGLKSKNTDTIRNHILQ